MYVCMNVCTYIYTFSCAYLCACVRIFLKIISSVPRCLHYKYVVSLSRLYFNNITNNLLCTLIVRN